MINIIYHNFQNYPNNAMNNSISAPRRRVN